MHNAPNAIPLGSSAHRRGAYGSLINRAFLKRFISVCALCLTGTAVAMGSGSGGGGGGGGGGSGSGSGSTATAPLEQEVGASAFKDYNEGVGLMHVRKFAAAQVKFEEAIRYKPNFAEAHNNLGFVLREQGPQNYAKALQHYNRAIQLKPKMPETYEYRGVLFAKMGRKADAEKDLATLKKLNSKLAGELETFLKTGEEVDDYGTSPKESG
ncbi:MAG TPA: tetratricopeptide repeat protein [Chthoniobacterales bacterium]|nr:tetratricopeptide repeat protein [Chthoniobacterales bacterium]